MIHLESTPKSTLFIFIVCLCLPIFSFSQQDTTTNRYASTSDASYWPTVNEGDYLIFSANNLGNTAIYFRDNNPSFPTIATSLGKKIHIWRGDYTRIYIEGGNCINTEAVPTIITNLGGQVKVGHNPNYNYRSLHLVRFDHIHLTGKYDVSDQTGDPNFRGHNDGADLGSGDYYEKYGIWAYPRWVGARTNEKYDNSVKISYFETIKLDYVASYGGGFSCFNLKSDKPSPASRVKIDVQDCFAGFSTGEGFYIGKTSSPSTSDITSLTMKNNIVVCAGAEAYQTGFLGAGSVIEHNIGLFSGSFFRRPFQAKYQDNGHQLTWAEGGIEVKDNLILGVPAQPLMVFWKNFGSRALPADSLPINIHNNYYGYGRSNAIYMGNGNDDVTPIFVQDNIFDEYATPSTRDAYAANSSWNVYARLRPCKNPLTVSGNLYPVDRPLFDSCYQNQETLSYGNQSVSVEDPKFVNLGFDSTFDYRNITFWSPTYLKTDKAGQDIPYAVDDVVHFYDSLGHIRFYECIQAHSGEQNPTSASSYWQLMTWNGRFMPPLDVRLEAGSMYDTLGIGLEYGMTAAAKRVKQSNFGLDGAAIEVGESLSRESLVAVVDEYEETIEVTIPEDISGRLEVYSLVGTPVFESEVFATRTTISTKHLSSGVYLVRWVHGSSISTRKVILRK